jgi:hypothetical protein
MDRIPAGEELASNENHITDLKFTDGLGRERIR